MLSLLMTTEGPSVKRPIDDALIRRIATGDMDALHTLYSSVCDSLYGFILSVVKDPHDADDVLQEAMLKVYTKAGEYIPQGKPLAWIFTIARHMALDKLRGRARIQPLEAIDGEAITLPGVEDVERRLLLETLLNRLPEEDRQILILHAVTGMKYREIAAVLELPSGTVRSRYHRAMERLKAIVKEEMTDDR